MDHKAAQLPSARNSSPRVPERRDPKSRERLRLRVRSEFDETPALVLTPAAAARLFGIREDICMRVLGELQSEGRLYSSGERYATRSLLD
jgi:hypothetical protein